MFTVEDVVRAVGGTAGPELALTTPLRGVSTDSRRVQPGELFVALAGPHFAGRDFIRAALAAGARAALGPRSARTPRTIRVADPQWALGELARWWRGRFDLPVVGITGSAGKTTTKNLVAAVLDQRWCVLRTAGNLNNLIGVPLTVLGLRPRHQAAVVEIGASAPGEVARLAAISRPTVGVITTVAPAHLAGFGSLRRVRAAKYELLRSLTPDGHAVVNYDTMSRAGVRRATRARIVSFAIENPADFRAKCIALNNNKTRFTVGRMNYQLPLWGIHHVYNALAALAVGRSLGISAGACRRALAAVRPEPGRGRLLHRAGVTIYDDAYNASPASLRAALATLPTIPGRRHIAVLGDMLELGPDAPAFHDAALRQARRAADRLILVGPQFARAAARAGRSRTVTCVADRGEAAPRLRALVEPGDVVLVKGSHALGLEALVAGLAGSD